MKKFGSWTELASLVLRAPTSGNTGTIDVPDTLGQNTAYGLPDPGGATGTVTLLEGSQTFSGEKTFPTAGFRLDTAGAGFLTIASASLGSDATLNLALNDASRTIDMQGNLTLTGDLTRVGAHSLTLTTTTTTNVTLPAAGTLATLSNNETLDNKIFRDFRYEYDAVAISGNSIDLSTENPNDEVILEISGTGPLNTMPGVSGEGAVKVLLNRTGGTLFISNDSGAQGFITGTGADLELADDSSVTVVWNSTDVRWYVIGGAGAGGGLTTQSVSGATTAVANTHYLVDTSGGPFTITLPATNKDGDVIRFTDATGSWAVGGSNNLTIAPDSGGQLDDLAVDETLVMDSPSSWIQFMWDASQSIWVSDDPLSPSGLSWLSIEGMTEAQDGATLETDKHYVVTSSTGGFTVNLPAGSDGFICRISDAGANFASGNVTVSSNGSEVIDDYAGGEDLVLDLNGIWVQFFWNGTQWITDDPIAPSGVPNIGGQTGGVLYNNASGEVTNAGADFVWDSANSRLGIGESSPEVALHITDGNVLLEGTDQEFLRKDSGGVNRTWLRWLHNGGNDQVIQAVNSAGTNTMVWQVSGSERMRINNEGDLLIGRNSSVEAAGSVRYLTLSDNTLGNLVKLELQGNRNTTGQNVGEISFYNDSNQIADIFCARGDANNSGDLVFRTMDSGSLGEAMRLTEEGRLGIGTDAPPSTLSVLDTTAGTTGIRAENSAVNASGENFIGLNVRSASNGDASVAMVHDGTHGIGVIILRDHDNSSRYLYFSGGTLKHATSFDAVRLDTGTAV